MLFVPYNITGYIMDCCRLNVRDIMAYIVMIMTFYSSVCFTNN